MDSDEHDCALNGGSDGCNDARCTFDSPQPARKGNSVPLAQVAQTAAETAPAAHTRHRPGSQIVSTAPRASRCVHSTTCQGCAGQYGACGSACAECGARVPNSAPTEPPRAMWRLYGQYAPFSGASSIVGRFFRLGSNFCGCPLPGMRCMPVRE